MTKEVLVELLQRHPFVEEFQPHHIEKLTALATEVTFDKNKVIFREGDECNQFYLVLAGKVVLEITAPGRTIRVQTLGPGDELGWSTMLMRDRKFFQAKALEPVRALAFSGAELMNACHEEPAFGFALMYRLLGVVARRLQATRLQILDVYSSKASGTAA